MTYLDRFDTFIDMNKIIYYKIEEGRFINWAVKGYFSKTDFVVIYNFRDFEDAKKFIRELLKTRDKNIITINEVLFQAGLIKEVPQKIQQGNQQEKNSEEEQYRVLFI